MIRLRSPIVQGHDRAEVHGVHVVSRAGHDLLDNKPVRLFRWMERIPKRIKLSVRAQVGESSAESNAIVRSLPTAGYLCCTKSCQTHNMQMLCVILEGKKKSYILPCVTISFFFFNHLRKIFSLLSSCACCANLHMDTNF